MRVCVCVLWSLQKKKGWSTSQMPPSKGRLFLASALLTRVHGMNRTQTKCVPPYGRSDYKAVQIFRGDYYRAESKTEFQHSGIWSFCLKGLISSFSGVLTMRLCLTVQLRQSCLSGPQVQPVLWNSVKSTTQDLAGTQGCLAHEIKYETETHLCQLIDRSSCNKTQLDIQ